MAPPAADTAPIYQLRLALRYIKPPIWRRLLVPADVTLADLHQIIVATMGWLDYHLHAFRVGRVYFTPDPEEAADWADEAFDENQVTLQELAPRIGLKLEYTYDFGDGWVHDAIVQKILPPDPKLRFPVCLSGKRATPPEDSGGPYFYDEFLQALRDSAHEEHDTLAEWAGDFDPEHFSLEEVNARLSALPRRRRRKPISEAAGTEPALADALVSLKVPRARREQASHILSMTDSFLSQHLTVEYVPVARRVVAALARKRPSPLAEGDPRLWAGAVLDVVVSVNAVLESPTAPEVWQERITGFVGLPAETLARQGMAVLSDLNLNPLDAVLPRHRQAVTDFLLWVQDVRDGFADPRFLPPALAQFAPLIELMDRRQQESLWGEDAPAEEPRPRLRLLDSRPQAEEEQ